jgi:hypothetical protein
MAENMTYFKSRDEAEYCADCNSRGDKDGWTYRKDGWTYKVVRFGAYWAVEVVDNEGHRLGYL